MTPADATVLASVDSPPMARLIRLTNKPSDNFFAETLLKDLAHQAGGRGHHRARRPRWRPRFARSARRARPARRRVGAVARRPRFALQHRAAAAGCTRAPSYDAFLASLPIAGQDGTLFDRMRRGPAHSRCRGKTGTLSNVSALSGYCEAR